MLTLQDITNQLSRFFTGGVDQGNGVTTYGASSSIPDFSNSTNTTGVSVPQVGSGANLDSGLGMNIGTGNLALSGLQALNGLIQGNKALNLAQDQFKFTKNITNTNLNNQIKSYNTALSDRLTSRAVAQGMSDDDRDRLIAANSLSR